MVLEQRTEKYTLAMSGSHVTEIEYRHIILPVFDEVHFGGMNE